ncbi:ribonuclease HII [Marinitoga sp. 1135]|uniref:Ribonuclease HII n=1 Tax=Marinitoga piezophila (strain DSM 14283 / JCM 11233 / KA3) TaxID=443254 RepID=H2J6M9_MARPK|nr:MULTISPECIES: ribonuclease HII [Marinitoga]AEX86310.1 ribonuclease HII [Marinitoga piezophila KA3]APT76714.1 ribonuclease HII [Marinitoga sp. 1137]NUU96493.1 ribonuclease HII [Marinitoga sp. 1135]NUU98412.1 ribonuclease HII [Marinitoga sp. 1138]
MDIEYLKKYGKIIGVDEAGRGPLAGPVVAAAIEVENENQLKILEEISNDSKKLSEKKREEIYEILIKNFNYSIEIATPEEIDIYNIFSATTLAIERNLKKYNLSNAYVIIDGKNFKLSIENYECIVKGDAKSKTIGAASILAKVYRDRLMVELDKQYPEYNMKKHKGYPTKEHIKLIEENGIKEFHRITFNPIKRMIIEKNVSINKKEFSTMRLMRIGVL